MADELTQPVHNLLFDPERFRHPQRDDRPGIRWWWQFDAHLDELLRELQVIGEAGFGEVEVAFSQGFWADARQREALAAVVSKAKRIDVGVAVTLGAEWPLRTPNTSTGTEYAARELHYGTLAVTTADGAVHGIPEPMDDPGRIRSERLLAVTVARVLRREDPPVVGEFRHWSGQIRVETRPPLLSTLLDHSSLADVTDRVRNGRLHWSAPDGDWAIFAFWTRDTHQGATSFIDRGAARAAASYLEEYELGADALPLLRTGGTGLFEDSLELDASSLFWSSDMLDALRTANGYDPTPYLPLLFAHGMCGYWVPNEEPTPDFELDTGDGSRLRADYYRLLTDRYISDHLLVFHEWAVSLGLRFKAQMAYGQNLDPIRSTREFVRAGGRAEGESLNAGDRAPVSLQSPTWRFALDHARTLVGGAHQGGATRVSSELGAQFDAALRQTLGDLQQMLDKGWAGGLTKPFVHGFASQGPSATWPTQSRFDDYAAESWNDTGFPQWAHWRPLTEYWARGTVVLETGVPRTDVAVLRDGFLTTAARGTPADDATVTPELADTRALEAHGYSVQYLDSIGLAQSPSPQTGELYPEGPAYRALVIDTQTLTAEAAENAALAAEHGLAVVLVGRSPEHDARFDPEGNRSKRVHRALARLGESPRTVRVDSLGDAAAALSGAGLQPRAAVCVPDTEAGVLIQWREARSTRLVLAYNPGPHERTIDLSLEGAGRVDELDLWSGDTVRVAHRPDGNRTVATVTLPAGGVRVLKMDVAIPIAARLEKDSDTEVVPLAWRLDVVAVTPTGVEMHAMPGQGAADWRTIPSLAGVSGTGTYRAILEDELMDATLELGELAGSAFVRVDGIFVGAAYVSGCRISLGSTAAGAVLEIEVATSIRNAVITHAVRPRLGEQFVAQGLLGPARLFTGSLPR